ncbi:MAG: hypothetical protein ACLRRN_03355 [Oscillospiraceae bacterium]
MSGFKDMVARDNFGVFLNCDEFAEKRTVKYDGATYEDIPIVLSGLKEKDRRQLMSDHAQGFTSFPPFSTAPCQISAGCSRRRAAYQDQRQGGRRRLLPGVLCRVLGL